MQSMIDQADDDLLLHEMKARKGELVAQKCLIYSKFRATNCELD